MKLKPNPNPIIDDTPIETFNPSKKWLTIKEKLLMVDFKNRYPSLSDLEIAEIFCVKKSLVEELFSHRYLTIESKMNKLINLNK